MHYMCGYLYFVKEIVEIFTHPYEIRNKNRN